MTDGGVLRRVDAVTVPVPDLETGVHFYVEGLGLSVRWRDTRRGQVGLALPDGDTELVLTTNLGLEPNWLVDDVPTAVATVVDHGGAVVSDVADIPVGRVAVVSDPFGNPLVLVDLSKGVYVTDDAKDVTGVRTD